MEWEGQAPMRKQARVGVTAGASVERGLGPHLSSSVGVSGAAALPVTCVRFIKGGTKSILDVKL